MADVYHSSLPFGLFVNAGNYVFHSELSHNELNYEIASHLPNHLQRSISPVLIPKNLILIVLTVFGVSSELVFWKSGTDYRRK